MVGQSGFDLAKCDVPGDLYASVLRDASQPGHAVLVNSADDRPESPLRNGQNGLLGFTVDGVGADVATEQLGTHRPTPLPVRNRSLRSTIHGAHILVALAGMLGALLTLTALRDAKQTVAVVAFDRSVPMGTALRSSDLTTVEVGAEGGALTGLYRGNDVGALVGTIVVSPIRKGDMVRRSDVRAPAADGAKRSISFALDSADAVGGAIEVGDRIDIVGVAQNGTKSGYVVTDASVLSVSNPQASGPLRSTDRKVTITIDIEPDAALRLVAAQTAGKIVVVRATGAAPQQQPAAFAPGTREVAVSAGPEASEG